MPRAALSLPPTINCCRPFQDAYCQGALLGQLVNAIKPNGQRHTRFWTFGKSFVPTTVALSDNRYAKSLDAFRDHIPWIQNGLDENGKAVQTGDPSAFYGLLQEYADAGIPRPSSYADVFHEKFYSPRVRWSENAAFAECLTGGWQTCTTGVHFGTYRKYDITSAYLWSGSLGMPDTKTFQKCRKLETCKGDTSGLFRVRLGAVSHQSQLPSPYNNASECIVTSHEIDTYGLRVEDILSGVTWRNVVSGDPLVNAVRSVSCWKAVARAYWGRWAQTAKVVCHANGKKWMLGNPLLNTVWAHTIVGRVRERLWKVSQNAVHIYVDSVITKDELITGSEVGDWRLEKTYPHGVIIKGPGQYGDRKARRLERMAGVAADSPKRDIKPLITTLYN